MEMRMLDMDVLYNGMEVINAQINNTVKGVRQKIKENSKELQALFARYGTIKNIELKAGVTLAYTYSKNLGTSKYPDCYREVAYHTITAEDKVCNKCIKTQRHGIIYFKYIIGAISI